MIVIQYDPTKRFTDEQKSLIEGWPALRRAIAAREEAGFKTSKILVETAFFLHDRLHCVTANVFYKTPGGGDACYNMNFRSDAAMLLVAFRVAADRAAQPDACHVVAIRQPRWAACSARSLEFPAGGLEPEEGANARTARKGALREFVEEAIAGKNRDLIPLFRESLVRPLGPPGTLHPATSDRQYQFFLELALDKKRFGEIAGRMSGSLAGLVQEQETTRVEVMPVRQCYRELLASGASPWSLQCLARYADRRKIWPQIIG